MEDETTTITASELTTTPPTATPPAQTADGVTFTPDQQAHIDKLIGDARTKARVQAKADLDKARTKAEQDAETARLAEQEQYRELSEKHAARIRELEPLETLVTGYRETIEGMLTSKVKTLDGKGDRATKAVGGLPGELDAKAKLDWLNANEALFATAPPPNIGATERGRETGDINFTDEQVLQYAAEMNIDPRYVDRQAMAADLRARAQGET